MRTSLFALLGILISTAALAQPPYYPGGYGYGYGYGYRHSSTAAEGYQRGYADIVRSTGMANLLNSEAAKNYEDARKAYLENRMRATQTYFEMRRYNEEARRAERGSPLSMEQYVRLARQQAPAQLTTSQLDPLTGVIGWPAVLRRPEYAALRGQIDKLFHDRAAGFVDPTAITTAIEQMQVALKADIAQYPANDYLAAKNFLDSLTYAGRSAI